MAGVGSLGRVLRSCGCALSEFVTGTAHELMLPLRTNEADFVVWMAATTTFWPSAAVGTAFAAHATWQAQVIRAEEFFLRLVSGSTPTTNQ